MRLPWIRLLLLCSSVAAGSPGSVSAIPEDVPDEFVPYIRHRRLEDGSLVPMVDVVVGVAEGDEPLREDEILGSVIAEFERSPARVARVTPSELVSLKQNNRFTYLEPDGVNHMHNIIRRRVQNEVPWTLEQIQATDERIPRENTGECVKVCLVDSGVLVEHPDLVSSLCGCVGKHFHVELWLTLLIVMQKMNATGVSLDDSQSKWDEPIVTADHGSHIAVSSPIDWLRLSSMI